MNRLLSSFVLAVASLAVAPFASATVLGFDDLPGDGFVPANYGGLGWSAGDWFAYGEEQAPFTPHSGSMRVASGFGDADAKTRDLDLLKADVIAGTLPKVSWICATSSGSEHPGASSPAQGAAYIAKVLDALTANPDVWSKTVLIINVDENDGFFDHVAPPAPPSYVSWNADPSQSVLAGASTVDASDEYLGDADGGITTVDPYKHHPFGLGPRVPLYVISPWSKGGWVNSQVFDQTSTIRFIEKRFGVMEPNISAWRRAVVGDLMTCFNFATPNDADLVSSLPDTTARDAASRALGKTTTPTVAPVPVLPVQARGIKPSRALPYALHATAAVVTSPTSLGATTVRLTFANVGTQAAVFHVYDRNNLVAIPRRYTVEAGKTLADTWAPLASGAHDLWVLAPGGFHRHFTGNARRAASAGQSNPHVVLNYDPANQQLHVQLTNAGPVAAAFSIAANAYYPAASTTLSVPARGMSAVTLPLASSGGWYDFSVRVNGQADYSRRFAGRMETGADSTSDPAMYGAAVGSQYKV